MACVRKRRDKWVADYRDRQGKRHWETYNTRKEADAALAERVHALSKGSYVAPGKEKTFEGLCEAFTAAHKPHVKENTWTDYGRNMSLHLEPFFAGHKLPEITVAHVESFVEGRLEHGTGERTINKCLTLLVSLFKYAGKHDGCTQTPRSTLRS